MPSDDLHESTADTLHALVKLACAKLEHDAAAGKGRAHVHLPSSWAQGRATFGGLLAALALALGEAIIPTEEQGPRRPARSLQITFVGPVTGDAVFELELLRHGRSASLVRATLCADGRVAMTATLCFAAARESIVEIPGPPAPTLPEPDTLTPLPFVEGRTPGFVRHVEMRFATQGYPGADNPSRGGGEFCGLVRLRDSDAPTSSGVIAALVDAWPSPVLQNFASFVPASSLSWTLEFVEPAYSDAPNPPDDAPGGGRWWTYAVETDRASGGWVHSRAQLWSPAGVLVATSTQTVAVYG